MSEHKILLFLGAGFSWEAFLPIMKKFGEFSEAQLFGSSQFDGIINLKNRLSYSLLKQHGEIFEGFRRYCKNRMNGFSQFDANNMEDLFTLAEMMHECGGKDFFIEVEDIETKQINKKKISTKSLLNSIRIWLWQIYRRLPLNNPKKWQIDPRPYSRFINIIKEYGLDKITVLTTNYDMLLEYLCNKEGAKVYYPIKSYKFKDVCDPDSPPVGNFVCGEAEYQNTLCLCKLHGSVNFFGKENSFREQLYIIPYSGGKAGNSKIKDLLPSIAALDSIDKLEKEGFLPSIIPPTYAKMQHYNWLQSIWNHAVKALSSSNKWIFIGYRFPPSDGHIQSLINLSLINRNNFPEVIAVAPDKETEGNYNQVFGENFEFCQKTLSKFIMEDNFENTIKNII